MGNKLTVLKAEGNRRPAGYHETRYNPRTGTPYQYWRRNTDAGTKSRLYVHHDGESLLENFGARASRPWKLYREILDEVREMLDLPEDVKFNWSRKAGCSCGCSPGFVITGHWGHDFWCEVSADGPTHTDHELALARRVQLGDEEAYNELVSEEVQGER